MWKISFGLSSFSLILLRLAIIDNYDSFTYNLVHYFESILNEDMEVFRNDQVSISDLEPYTHICISPGPGLPHEAGITLEAIKTYQGNKNILGVCLGMQAMSVAFGGKLLNLEKVQHGVSRVTWVDKNDRLFKGMPERFMCGRYHSWVVDPHSIPRGFVATAFDDDRNVMALSDHNRRLYGVQFHPESVLTENGTRILENWLDKN